MVNLKHILIKFFFLPYEIIHDNICLLRSISKQNTWAVTERNGDMATFNFSFCYIEDIIMNCYYVYIRQFVIN